MSAVMPNDWKSLPGKKAGSHGGWLRGGPCRGRHQKDFAKIHALKSRWPCRGHKLRMKLLIIGVRSYRAKLTRVMREQKRTESVEEGLPTAELRKQLTERVTGYGVRKHKTGTKPPDKHREMKNCPRVTQLSDGPEPMSLTILLHSGNTLLLTS